jgi:hypothetical protein
MPYRHAHWYILGLIPLILLAFYPSYFGQFRTASWEFHAHGATAAAWLLLLAGQSYTIHSGNRAAHRAIGPAVLAMFPLFLAGGAGIFLGMADRYAAGSPFHLLYAPNLFWFDVVGVGMFAAFVYQGLKNRRNVQQHSAWMLATLIALLPPIFGRLSGIPLGVRGPEDFHKLGLGFHLANLLIAGLAFTLARRAGKNGRPWLIAGLATLTASVLFQFPGDTAAWEAIFARLAPLPSAPFVLLAGVAGIAIAAAGWLAGKRPSMGGALPAE